LPKERAIVNKAYFDKHFDINLKRFLSSKYKIELRMLKKARKERVNQRDKLKNVS